MASNNEGVAAVAWWTVIAVALFFMFGTDACKEQDLVQPHHGSDV